MQPAGCPSSFQAMERAGPSNAFQALEIAGSKQSRLGFVAGLIQTQKMGSFERLLFRATRGNMFMRSTDVGVVQDPSTTEMQEKTVFVIFFAGDRSKTKIMKVPHNNNLGVT